MGLAFGEFTFKVKSSWEGSEIINDSVHRRPARAWHCIKSAQKNSESEDIAIAVKVEIKGDDET